MSDFRPRGARGLVDPPIRTRPIPSERSADGRVVPLRLTVQPAHRLLLDAWVRAGGRLGLLDADVNREDAGEVFVWVRENPEPAYSIRGGSRHWAVWDRIHGRTLGAFARFEEALACIRPVGDAHADAPAGRVPARIADRAP